jgi:hypothetical protein
VTDPLGLTYIAGILWGYVLFYLWERVPRRRGFLLLLFSPLVLVVVLRYSGTDTYGVYEVALWHTFRTGLPTGFEAGFDALARSLLGLTGSPVWAVRGVGVLFGFLLALFLARSDPLERRFFFLLYVPAFFFPYGMNALRAGLALALLLLAWQEMRRGRPVPALGLAALAPLFHTSALVAVGLLAVGEFWRWGKRGLLALGLLALLGLSLLALEGDRLVEKVHLYLGPGGEEGGPSVLTPEAPGASRTLMVGLVLGGLLLTPIPLLKRLLAVALLGGATVLFQGAAYMAGFAGVRLLELAAFAAPLVALRLAEGLSERELRGLTLALVLAGGLGGAFNQKNFWEDWGGKQTGTLTPFIPYRTVWNHDPCLPSSYHRPREEGICPTLTSSPGSFLPVLEPSLLERYPW